MSNQSMFDKIRESMSLPTAQPLASWLSERPIPHSMCFRGAALEQFYFVEHQLAPLFECEPTVIGAHRSKNIELPVFVLSTPYVCFVMRNNFHNWKISCISSQPVAQDLRWMNKGSHLLHPVYFEGFPEKLVFGPWAPSQCKWSAEVFDNWHLFGLIVQCRYTAKCW